MKSKISWFGIDFGTTNSAAFSLTGTNVSNVMPIHYGDDEGRPFPSVVAIDRNSGEILVGREAKDRRNSLIETHDYFDSIKSIIDSDQKWMIAGKEWSAVDITATILKSLKERAEVDSDNCLDEAVIAIPIGYSSEKKKKLRDAAAKAGIKIKLFVNEPTAAFCSNYNSLKECKNVAVFDWGGGTLDVVVLRVDCDEIQELAAEGMHFAGNDIDLKLAEKMHTRFMRKKEKSIAFDDLDPVTKDQLLMKSEKAKCDFEDEDYVSISINRYGEFGAVRDSVDYDFFSLLIDSDVDQAISCLKKAIGNAGLNQVSIDRILCVGGSSKLRPLREKLEKEFGKDLLFYPEQVMWDIAKGAALIATSNSCYTLSKPIGLQLCDGSFLALLNKGQQIPCEECNIQFSVVDQEPDGPHEARFIFTDSEAENDRELYSPFVFPLRGFMDERLYLKCYVDQDNVFRAKVGSNRVPESRDRVWCFDNLRISFKIER